MKKKALLIITIVFAAITACAQHTNPEIKKALKTVPKSQREGLEFLVKYMPKGDLDTLTADFLLTELDWAYKARETFAWCKELPDSIFFNDVLPYASMDETREPWREMFWTKLYPLVKDVKDVRVAIDTINKSIKELVGVEYNTKRKRPNQSPSESMEIGMASCSGLSIILTDAFRTMGIPSRIAGTPLWVSGEGNHNWSEVWFDGAWYFTEYYPNEALNKSWFLERAGKADKSRPETWMYATAWKEQANGQHFPMVWAKKDKSVPGIDVTDFYIALYQAEQAEKREGNGVAFKLYKNNCCDKVSGDRVAELVEVLDQEGKVVASGNTSGPTADMNDYLVLYLPDGKYTVEFKGKNGNKRIAFESKDQNVVELYYE
ncbi:MAG: transglutaminase-like domain-containing protein [Phocaeicola sp.]